MSGFQKKPTTLETLLEELRSAIDWLNGFGIQLTQTRFAKTEKNLALVFHHNRAGTKELLPNLVSPTEYGLAYVEAVELVNVRNALNSWKSSRFVEKLRLAAEGPPDPREEKSLGLNARDILFELSAAAFFRTRRIPVLIGFEGDGILRFEDERILVECKRVRSSNGVKSAIEKAVKQINQRLTRRKPRGGFGLICLDISLIMNPKLLFLQPSNETDLQRTIEETMSSFSAKNDRNFLLTNNPRILGTLLFFKTAGFDQRESRYLSIFKTDFKYAGEPNSYTEFLAKRFHRKLLVPLTNSNGMP
jgi:hypothetical protein